MLPGGRGFEACLRVRLLHASVRARLAGRGWDAAAYGVPVNQEDMAATLLAFSYNVLVGVELLKGRRLSPADEDAYLHLWRCEDRRTRETHRPARAEARVSRQTSATSWASTRT